MGQTVEQQLRTNNWTKSMGLDNCLKKTRGLVENVVDVFTCFNYLIIRSLYEF